jgi:cellulose synthase/poly-beta-1,6-N-acetylglucosamine synthase-like glycosyltransferase
VKVLFFISVAFIAYTYLVYPLVIVVWAALFPKRVEKRYKNLPVSVVVAARNEEIHIKTRIENLIEQDYPRALVEIIVVSDGSSDRTSEVARAFEDRGVVVLETPGPIGKAGALNSGVERASNDIVVFADARQRFSPNALAELVSMFNDPTVGAVSGELIIEGGAGGEVHEGVGLYWEYEKLIRRSESAAASVVGATGSIYAVRKRLFEPLGNNTLLDDFLVPMRIVLAGYRVLFTRKARAYDISSATAGREFARKVRTLAGNFQAVALEPRLIHPGRNPVFFQFVSHKLARLAVPYFCALALVTSALTPGAFYATLFALQLAFYGLGLLARTPLGRARAGRIFRLSLTFTVLNAAAVAGLWVFLAGKDRAVWKKA